MVFIRRKRAREEGGASQVSSKESASDPSPIEEHKSPVPAARYARTMKDALQFLAYVEGELTGGERYKFSQFVEILCQFKRRRIGRKGVISRVKILFAGRPDLILGFNDFLPPEYKINIED